MFHDLKFNFRIKSEIMEDIEKIVESNLDKYDSIGHFIRAAVIEKIRKEKK